METVPAQAQEPVQFCTPTHAGAPELCCRLQHEWALDFLQHFIPDISAGANAKASGAAVVAPNISTRKTAICRRNVTLLEG